MIKKRSSVLFVMIGMLGVILLGGCGAGTSGDVPAPPPGQTVAASIDLLVSNPQLDSDVAGAPTVTLTAIVKDSSNRALSEKEVAFTADSGLLAVTSGTTDANGRAAALAATRVLLLAPPTLRREAGASGADAVAMVEHTEELDQNTVEILKAVAPFDNVVRKGEDFKARETLLTANHRLRPQ